MGSNSLASSALEMQKVLRAKAPLIHHITNYVVMNFTANVTLALGAQPVMAHAPQEMAEMQGFASALVLNIGTLEDAWIESMVAAGKHASSKGTPIVLDPVGAGASRLRTDAARRILNETHVTVLRGNAGEVLAVAGDAGRVRGVDSTAASDDAVDVARHLARERNMVVAVTGKVDIVTDGTQVFRIENGHPMMSRVTGTGCAATSAIACFLAVCNPSDRALATASALALYGRAGELAASTSKGPGSFVPALLDALYFIESMTEVTQLAISVNNDVAS